METNKRALRSTPETDEGDERVADASTGEDEFEATPMEAACKMLFGEHEAPRMIQALSAARARERDARARREAEETPETQSRKGSHLDRGNVFIFSAGLKAKKLANYHQH